MDNKLKTLLWKLDREIWAKVEVHEATQSWGREQSGKLIEEYTESANKELKDALKDLLVFVEIMSHNKIDIKAHDQKVFDKLDQFKRLVQ